MCAFRPHAYGRSETDTALTSARRTQASECRFGAGSCGCGAGAAAGSGRNRVAWSSSFRCGTQSLNLRSRWRQGRRPRRGSRQSATLRRGSLASHTCSTRHLMVKPTLVRNSAENVHMGLSRGGLSFIFNRTDLPFWGGAGSGHNAGLAWSGAPW